MREELRTIGSKGRHVFTATFVRFGFRNGYIGPVKTMLLQDVTLDSKIVSDHLWFDLTKGFSDADLSPGDVVEFCARVSAYEKGYKGHKDDVLNRPIEKRITQMRSREDAKGRRRSVLMTPPVPEKVRVLSPAWYRAAVEFQGRPEQERLAFCSWCCCHGGCNLCMDISKYNIKGLKIYGG